MSPGTTGTDDLSGIDGGPPQCRIYRCGFGGGGFGGGSSCVGYYRHVPVSRCDWIVCCGYQSHLIPHHDAIWCCCCCCKGHCCHNHHRNEYDHSPHQRPRSLPRWRAVGTYRYITTVMIPWPHHHQHQSQVAESEAVNLSTDDDCVECWRHVFL